MSLKNASYSQRNRWLLPCSLPAQVSSCGPSGAVSASRETALLGTSVGPHRVSVCKRCISCHTGHVWFVPACARLVYQLGSSTKGTAISLCHLECPLSGDHTVSFQSLEVPWECAISVWMYGFFVFVCFCVPVCWLQMMTVVMPCVFALLVTRNVLSHFLTASSQPPLHPLIPQSCISSQSWEHLHRLLSFGFQAWASSCVVAPQHVLYVHFHCAWSNHICYEIGLKAQNKIGLKLLGGSMLLGCFIHLFWRNTCIFWMEEEVWFAGLWCELCEAFIFETVSWSPF